MSEAASGLHVVSALERVLVGNSPDDPTVVRIELQVPLGEVRPWHVDDPFLHLVRARLEPAGGGAA